MKILQKRFHDYFMNFFSRVIYNTHTAPKYLENIVKVFLANVVRLLKYFETYH